MWLSLIHIFGETLFHYSDSMEIEPWLAESYELVDATTWRITLHEGISFTSGRTLDAEAVKECLEDLIAVQDVYKRPGVGHYERSLSEGGLLY